jgi:hypothetical protein
MDVNKNKIKDIVAERDIWEPSESGGVAYKDVHLFSL